jgi:hypothetical protein
VHTAQAFSYFSVKLANARKSKFVGNMYRKRKKLLEDERSMTTGQKELISADG